MLSSPKIDFCLYLCSNEIRENACLYYSNNFNLIMYSTEHDIKTEKIAEILAFIIHLMGGKAKSKTKLFKLIYLLDAIQSRKNKKNKFSGVTLQNYFYDPYSEEIENAIFFLSDQKYISVEKVDRDNGNTRYDFNLRETPILNRLTTEDKQNIRKSLSSLFDLHLSNFISNSSEP